MKTSSIVTNLRIPKNEWLQVKATAAELGMSFNEYVNLLIRERSQARELGSPEPLKTEETIWDLPSLASSSTKDAFSLSDDELIYGI